MQPIFIVSVFFGIPTFLLVIGTIVNGGCLCDIDVPECLKEFIRRHVKYRHIDPDENIQNILT